MKVFRQKDGSLLFWMTGDDVGSLESVMGWDAPSNNAVPATSSSSEGDDAGAEAAAAEAVTDAAADAEVSPNGAAARGKPAATSAASSDLGKAVHIDLMKPISKGLGAKRLKGKCDKLLSNFALNFNSCRYSWGSWGASGVWWMASRRCSGEWTRLSDRCGCPAHRATRRGRAVQVDPIKPELKQRLVSELEAENS
jgi:hypothetical protein